VMHHACMPGMLVLEKNCGEKLGDSTAVYELFANLYNFKNYTYSFCGSTLHLELGWFT